MTTKVIASHNMPSNNNYVLRNYKQLWTLSKFNEPNFSSKLSTLYSFVDLWECFVGKADMYMRDGLHLSGKEAAVFADELSAAVDSGTGSITTIFCNNHCLN